MIQSNVVSLTREGPRHPRQPPPLPRPQKVPKMLPRRDHVKARRGVARLLTVQEDETDDSEEGDHQQLEDGASLCHRRPPHQLPHPPPQLQLRLQPQPSPSPPQASPQQQQQHLEQKRDRPPRSGSDVTAPGGSPDHPNRRITSLSESLAFRMSEASSAAQAGRRLDLDDLGQHLPPQDLDRQRYQYNQQQRQHQQLIQQQRRLQQQYQQNRQQLRRTSAGESIPLSPSPFSNLDNLDDDIDNLFEKTQRWNEDNLSPITSFHLRTRNNGAGVGGPSGPTGPGTGGSPPIKNSARSLASRTDRKGRSRGHGHHGNGTIQSRLHAQAVANSVMNLLSSPTARQQQLAKFCDHCERRFGIFRISRVCHVCDAQVCRACTSRKKFSWMCRSDPPICKLCARIAEWEGLLLYSMLPTLAHVQSTGKASAAYDGIAMRPVYHAWLKGPPPRHLFCVRQERVRNQFILQHHVTQLMNRQVWNQYVSHVGMNMNNITNCFISLMQDDEQFIVCQFGKVSPYLVFPRAISICEYTVWSESGILIPRVSNDTTFANNPMLKLLDAEFYYGVPIYCDGLAIGSLAVVDSSPHDIVRAEDIQLLKITSDAIGKRLSRLITRENSRKMK